MYKWKIEFILNSGKELIGYYEGTENNTMDVAKKMLAGDKNTLNGFNNKDKTKHIFVRVGEIASASISAV